MGTTWIEHINTQLVTAESLKYTCTMILIQPDSNRADFLTCRMTVVSSVTFTKTMELEIFPNFYIQFTKQPKDAKIL